MGQDAQIQSAHEPSTSQKFERDFREKGLGALGPLGANDYEFANSTVCRAAGKLKSCIQSYVKNGYMSDWGQKARTAIVANIPISFSVLRLTFATTQNAEFRDKFLQPS